MAIETGCTFLKRTADGREVLSSYLDTDAGEERLGAFLNLQPKEEGGDGGLSLSPNSGPLHSNTDVVFHGTGFNPAWTYGASLYDDGGVAGGISSSWILSSATPNTTTEIHGMILSGDITEMASAPGTHQVQLRSNDGSGWQNIEPPLTFTYT